MPLFIKKCKLDIAKNTNNMYTFMTESDLIFDNNYYLPFNKFEDYYTEFCMLKKIKSKNINF